MIPRQTRHLRNGKEGSGWEDVIGFNKEDDIWFSDSLNRKTNRHITEKAMFNVNGKRTIILILAYGFVFLDSNSLWKIRNSIFEKDPLKIFYIPD